MRVTVLGGARTVGAVQILVRTGTSAVVLDFGVVGNPRIVRDATLFNEFSVPRQGREIADYLLAGMAPPLGGMYAPELLGEVGARAVATGSAVAAKAAVTPLDLTGFDRAVVVSHAHDDHMRLIEYLSDDVPVIMSEAGREFHAALTATGIVPRPATAPIGLPSFTAHHVGELTVTLVPVDHDIPGATGVIVTAPSGARLAYTGDWRRHGRHPELMERFAKAAHGADLLITEASTTDHDPSALAAQIPERAVAAELASVCAATTGTVYLSFHQRNIERHDDIRRVAAEAGRKMVVSHRTASLWREYTTGRGVPGDLFVWATDPAASPIAGARPVDPEEVRRNPQDWVSEMPVRLLPTLLDTAAGPADAFVMCNGHPYSAASPHWAVLRTWVRELGLSWYEISSHGHALRQDLAWLVEKVAPEMVLPVHTNNPEAFPPGPAWLLAARDGDEWEL